MGTTLVWARRMLGMSQRELGERVGVRQPQIARWESNAYKTATLARVDAVAQALGVGEEQALLAAESPAAYTVSATTGPVRDLGEIAARVRADAEDLRRFGLSRLRVFGSFATGTQSATSDVDILVEFDRPVGFEYLQAGKHLKDLLGREVDPMQESLIKPRLRDRVLREAVEVWHAPEAAVPDCTYNG